MWNCVPVHFIVQLYGTGDVLNRRRQSTNITHERGTLGFAQIVQLDGMPPEDEPSVAFYPDSGKVGVWPAAKLFRLADEVDYFDGEV